MVLIKDQKAINEYRERKRLRRGGRNWAEEMNMGSLTGEVKPTVMSARDNRVIAVRLSEDNKPKKEYRFLKDGEILPYLDWIKANKPALKPLYEDGGMDAIKQEYYKGLMVNSSRGLKRIGREQQEEELADRIDADYIVQPNDGKYRERLIKGILKERGGRNAALNVMYDNYVEAVDGCKPFGRFLDEPVKLYMVGSGDMFSSYSFINDGGQEIEIRPIDTFGSFRDGAEAAVMVPFWRVPNGTIKREDREWEWYAPDKWVFEEESDEPAEVDAVDAIKSEAEMIKLFSDGDTEISRLVVDRCADSIHRLIKKLSMMAEEVHTDSAFFAGELDDNLGEFEVQYPEVQEFRERRQKRMDARLDDEWKTIKGTHVLIDDDGSIKKGPENLKNISREKQGGMSVGKEMSPVNSDYDYEDGDTEEDFTHKNIAKLKKIYDEHGFGAVQDEWYKFRMANGTKDLHQISKDEADEVVYDNVRQSIYDGWFRAADSSYKPQLTDAVVKNAEMRNAALNLAYENYRQNTDSPLSFEEFLVTPIKVYRGEKGQKHVEDDVFDAYTFDKKMARHFAGDKGTVTEAEVRPIDTYGSMRAVGEAEIWVPRQISPVGYKSERKRKKARSDAKDDVDWITVNGNHIPIDEEGNPVGGQKKALGGGDMVKPRSWEKSAIDKIKGSNYQKYGIKITDKEQKNGFKSPVEMARIGSYVEDKPTAPIERNALHLEIKNKDALNEDYLREQVKMILEEHGDELRGKNVYLVGANRGANPEAEVLCKVLERGGEEEKSLLKRMPVNESATEKRYGDRRKQVPVPPTKIASYKEEKLKRFNERALESIIEETGMKKADAKKFQQSLLNYMGGDYIAFAKGEKADEVRKIDDGLGRMGAYDGEIWRGMRFRDDAPDGAPDSGGVDDFKNLNIGDEIGMKSVSSWTSREDVARQFAGVSSSGGIDPTDSVIIKCKNNKTSVGLQHVSKYRGEEAEVLAKSTARWRVTGKKILSVYDYMSGRDVKWKDKIDKNSLYKGFKKNAKNHVVVLLEVEEI